MNEQGLLELLSTSKNIRLIEPTMSKYFPLGLSKIRSFVAKNNKNFKTCWFARNYTPLIDEGADLICVSSLFTYYSDDVFRVLDELRSYNYKGKLVLGGIFASLMPNYIKEKYETLEIFEGYSKELDMCKPEYDFWFSPEKKFDGYSFIFTSRGCVNRCLYCAVHKIEKDVWINPKWKDCVDLSKPKIMVSDNNLTSMPMEHIRDVLTFIKDNKLSAMFDNGFDVKCLNDETISLLKTIKIERHGLRLAFDRIEEDHIFQETIRRILKAGISKEKIQAYVLFNFNDTPKEAQYRMEECIGLGIRPYPQMFVPLNTLHKNDKYVGKHWTLSLANKFRYFYLMAGLYTKERFSDWILKKKYDIDEDIECLSH